MRIKNSLLNYSTGIIIRLVTLILNFTSRTVFISTLGVAYLGINGLMLNVMSMLSIAELGIGTAITFSLYKPLHDKNEQKIIQLMSFFKKIYKIIGVILLLLGMVLIIFINYIIKDPGNVENIRLIFFLYLVSTVLPYFVNYKEVLIKADQKEYKLATVTVVFSILNVTFQILILLLFKNFILYLISNIIITFSQALYINYKITKIYPILNNKSNERLPSEELNNIKRNIKALFFHKIGGFSIHSTDNIIISSFINVSTVGIYSNYTMIINAVNSFVTLFFSSVTASMGNLIASSDNAKKLKIFELINFIGFWLYGLISIFFLNLLNPTIELWLGEQFLLSKGIIIVIIINFYLTGMRMSIETVKTAAGLYDVDKYSPLIQAAVNLVASIILVNKWGLLGVFIGTLISSLVLPIWQRPYLLYKYVFKVSSKYYFLKFLNYFIVILVISAITSLILNKYFVAYTISNYIIRIIICIVVPNIIIILIFIKTREFKGILDIIKSLFRREAIEWKKK